MGVFGSLYRALAWWIPQLIAAAFGGNYRHAFISLAAVYIPLVIIYTIMAFKVENQMDDVNHILSERSELPLRN